jgi:PAS domain S-box-containing protein
VVIFTGRGDEDIAVELMKAGASDYLPKASLTPERLAAAIRHALELARTAAARRRAEDELREQEVRFRTLANAIPQLAWMSGASGGRDWYNQRWYDYTGTTLEEVQGWGWQKVHHSDHVQRVTASIQRSLTSGEPWEESCLLRGKDGQYRWFLSRALPIRDEQGRIACWFGTNTDINERRWTEALLAGERQVLEMTARGLPLAAVLDVLLRTVEELAGDGLLASIQLLDEARPACATERPPACRMPTTGRSTAGRSARAPAPAGRRPIGASRSLSPTSPPTRSGPSIATSPWLTVCGPAGPRRSQARTAVFSAPSPYTTASRACRVPSTCGSPRSSAALPRSSSSASGPTTPGPGSRRSSDLLTTR